MSMPKAFRMFSEFFAMKIPELSVLAPVVDKKERIAKMRRDVIRGLDL